MATDIQIHPQFEGIYDLPAAALYLTATLRRDIQARSTSPVTFYKPWD